MSFEGVILQNFPSMGHMKEVQRDRDFVGGSVTMYKEMPAGGIA